MQFHTARHDMTWGRAQDYYERAVRRAILDYRRLDPLEEGRLKVGAGEGTRWVTSRWVPGRGRVGVAVCWVLSRQVIG